MKSHGLYSKIEVTDEVYNTFCRYISKCYDERPIGRQIAGELAVYSLSYEQYQNVKLSILQELNRLMDATVSEDEKHEIMHKIHFHMSQYLTKNKATFMV